ncbi:class I tRNA ligase family protein [Methanoculleus chikugoensis]|uniref:class I tRNA ligase family protein n=1 Tax=Methanoculleus chikugoensis TaxID=118126 RepID=UPI001FB3B5AA|nr:class I tRNA ligase family protein [Methanoculleus chikugoensis]
MLVTCGLPYTNGPCHIGHLRTYVPADFYVRYMRRSGGEEVVFICGSDNHGTPIVISAEQEGSTPPAPSRSGITSTSTRRSAGWRSSSTGSG